MHSKGGIRKYVLLDRDGTIIVNKHYQKDPDETELLPFAREGLDKLRSAGFALAVITNQSGIARGLLTRSDLAAVNKSMVDLLGGGDTYFAGIYYCPHGPDDQCSCRKPGTGLVNAAASELGFAMCDCYVIGDNLCDMELGKSLGAPTILVRTGHGAKAEKEGETKPDYVADNLLDAAEWIIGRENGGRNPL